MNAVANFEPILTIGTIAKKLGVAVQTLRLYEQEGLIIPFKTDSGRRMYSLHDLERLQCIRKMITKNRLNLQGIKRLLALVPCWNFKGGIDDDCINCPAYTESSMPCWNYTQVGDKCKNQDCRECPVYTMEFNCHTMKEIIYGHSRS